MDRLRTIGGIVIALGSTAIAIVLVLREAPVASWATALAIALLAATIIKPEQLLYLLGKEPPRPRRRSKRREEDEESQ